MPRALKFACPPAKQMQYNAYYHGFQTLKDLRPVADMQQNDHFVKILRRLVDEHCKCSTWFELQLGLPVGFCSRTTTLSRS